MEQDLKIEYIKNIIKTKVFIKNDDKGSVFHDDNTSWIFDFRKVLMNGEVSNQVSDIFYDLYKDKYPFQICTLEIGGVPLATSLMNKFYFNGHKDINSFFIRKSRKKTGLLSMIEGNIDSEKSIVLVDDTMNSGNSFWRQIEVLEDLGYKVDTVWSIIRYRDEAYYKRFHNRNIKVRSLFTLDDFTSELGSNIKNIVIKEKQIYMPFVGKWVFKSENPSLGHVVPKSQPVLDEDTIYFGSDNEIFWAINQTDGTVKWSFKVGRRTKKKSIFSSPALYKNLVIFGSYDGNIYALNKKTGEQVWVSFEADWVGSSPDISIELNLVFIGLEFGLFGRRGGIAALDADTGKTLWKDSSHHALTHASPKYIDYYEQVAIGSNEGMVRLYEAKTGKLIWTFTTFGGAEYDKNINAGFGKGEIKESIAYDKERDYLIFGATDGFLYILNRENGQLVHHFKCAFAVWATPLVFDNCVYFTSLDKRLRCVNLDTFELVFDRDIDGTRIFSSPTVIDKKLYVGTNAGRLYELHLETGEELGYYQTRERITNSVIKNQSTELFFLPTYANEIICLEKNKLKP